MADFNPAYERMILDEGGYTLTNIPGDRGGHTYAGISRKSWSQWAGWVFVDRGETPPTDLVRDFYRSKFWDAVRGDAINNQVIASSLFNFAVNAGAKTAIKLAQIVAGVASDGIVGPKTLEAWNKLDTDYFRASYGMAKVARYAAIVNHDKSQRAFLLGWINRALREASA